MRVDEINRKLHELYGSINGEDPTFRIVWSADQTEVRYGEYEDYSPGGIFLRSYVGIRRVPKYQEDPPAYVLERMIPNTNSDLIDAFLSYEPLFFFKREDGTQLPLEWRAIEMIMWTILYGPREASKMAIGSPEWKQKEYLETLDYLQDESPYLVGMLHDGRAVVNPWGTEKFGGVG